MKKRQKNIIDLFEENELNVGMLYKLYSQKIPGHKRFWFELSMEEASHASDIRAIYRKKSEDLVEENKFTRGVLKYVTDFVEEKIRIARENKISHLEALNIALRVEQSILEKKCFELFISTNEKLKAVIKRLDKETEGHVNRLRKELKRQK
jgi:rubrerythrin